MYEAVNDVYWPLTGAEANILAKHGVERRSGTSKCTDVVFALTRFLPRMRTQYWQTLSLHILAGPVRWIVLVTAALAVAVGASYCRYRVRQPRRPHGRNCITAAAYIYFPTVGAELRSRDENMSSCFCQNQHNASSLDMSVSERSPAIAGSAYSTFDKIKARKSICLESDGSPWVWIWTAELANWSSKHMSFDGSVHSARTNRD